ncbi:MAG TPA: outer membrane beta-barrel protein [Stellaceae bacterium]|nr:outer membrane beta-barrel protein [Stellaceae bacterium]
MRIGALAAIGTCVVMALSAATAARAQDATTSWNGFYGELSLGGRFATARQKFSNNNSTGEYSVDGIIGGAGIGHDWQLGRFVIGTEAEMSGASSNGIAHQPNTRFNYVTANDWLGIIGARAGYDLGLPVLPFVTAGVAVGNVAVHDYRPNGPGTSVDYSGIEPGWTVGAGVESQVFWSHLSVKAEYRYVSLDYAKGTGSANSGVAASFNQNIVQASLVYRLN